MGASSYDVVIVGAGAAGIAAGRLLQRHGRRALLLEARERVGGRAWTDTAALGLPFDMGAAWLHDARGNPLAGLAASDGVVTRVSERGNERFLDHGEACPPEVMAAYRRAARRVERRGRLRAWLGPDVPLAQLAGRDPWEAVAVGQQGGLSAAEAPDAVSARDFYRLPDGVDLLVEGGLGAFVAGLADGLEVRLNTPVQRIDASGPEVAVSGAFGTVRAGACLVTVPTGVLAAGAIAFEPALPAAVTDAFAALPLSLLLKVGFRLKRRLPLPYHFVAGRALLLAGRIHIVHLHPTLPLLTVFAGGAHAREVSAEGEGAKRAFAEDVLVETFGTSIREELAEALTTGWDADPFARGAYAVPRPGHVDARRVYRHVHAGRVHFAGEAGGGRRAMTVAGAWQSGERAAARILGGA